MAVTLHEYVNELVKEIGNLPTFAKAHRAHELAIYLPALIALYDLHEEIDLSFTNKVFEDSSHEIAAPIKPANSKVRSRTQEESQALTNLVGMAETTNQLLYAIGVKKLAKPTDAPQTVPNQAPPQRPARTQEQKDYHAAKMRGYRAKQKAALQAEREAFKKGQ